MNMTTTISIRSLLFLATLTTVASCSAGDGYKTNTDNLVCGKAVFTIESTCKKSKEEHDLNVCKPQTLTVNKTRKVALPDFTPAETRRITDAGGATKDLFVIQWGCVKSKGTDVAVLAYSTGGGNAPYSESQTKYDDTGKLLGKEHRLAPEVQLALEKSMTKVRSIMPEN